MEYEIKNIESAIPLVVITDPVNGRFINREGVKYLTPLGNCFLGYIIIGHNKILKTIIGP